MNNDISEILDSSPKKRVLVLINHQAEISLGNKGFLSEPDISLIVSSFKTDKELKVYSQYREIFKKVQHFLTSINQIHLMYKSEINALDKLIILKEIKNDLNNIQSSISDETLKIRIIESINNSTTSRIFKEVIRNSDLDNNLIPGYRELLRRRQISLKSAIQGFKDALKEHSFKVKAFERRILSIEDQQDNNYKKKFLDSILAEEPDYKSVKVDYDQYKKFREMHL